MGHTASNEVDPISNSRGTADCSQLKRLFCFEVGRNVTVTPVPIVGRRVFRSTLQPLPTSGLAGMDARCAADAAQAGLTGTFRAAIATTTTTVASRFVADTRPWIRIDGAEVAPPNGAGILDETPLESFINQEADGTYRGDQVTFAGAMSPSLVSNTGESCQDWMTTQNTAWATCLGAGELVMWNTGATATCDRAYPLLCVE
jgi:hypothetical protein